MLKRTERHKRNATIEPLYISVPKGKDAAFKIAGKLAKSRHRTDLFNYIIEAPEGLYEQKKKSKFRKVILNKQALNFIKLSKLRKKLIANHHNLFIDLDQLRDNPNTINEMLKQLSLYHSQRSLNDIKSAIRNRSFLSVDKKVLSKFGRKMVGKFPLYRGPNCFHASVAFQDSKLPTLPSVNLREEPNHHKAMINNDELLRILSTYFYEVDPKVTELKYGDIIAFFDVPKNQSTDKPSYKWLKHASSYLFSGYVFSKGSKSPNTPYTVKTLSEEWGTWSKYTKNLGVKVFRRSFKNVKRNPPMDRTDWLF